jgi:Ca2+-binding EF-hand superfamily protein
VHLKKLNIQVSSLYKQIDKNGNGLCEREEFINAFTNEIKVAGLLRTELEQIYEALDSNKDGFLSVNEFCLYLEGIQLTMD